MIQDLTLPAALELVPHIDARHRYEILNSREDNDLERWALDRCTLPGSAWALRAAGDVVWIGGVVSSRDVGTLWLVGRQGWQRYVKSVLRIVRAIRSMTANPYRFLECKCYADNRRARRFAERLGFEKVETIFGATRDGAVLVQYRMAA